MFVCGLLSAGCMTVVVPLASGVCPLVGKAGLEARAGFLAGGGNGTLSCAWNEETA